ncbi:MAG: PAS domain-containing protein [Sphingomonas taxi]
MPDPDRQFAERLSASGDVGAMIARLDRSAGPLGPVAEWPVSLRNAVSLMVGAQAEIVLFWGADYVALYNDAYAPTIGDKHPAALGRPAREYWSELWHDLEPLLRGVRETGRTFAAKDRPFYIERHGGAGETVYFDVSYSAVPDDDGSVGGVLCIVSETTQRVLAERRVRESNDRLHAYVSASATSMYRMSADWREMRQLDGRGFLSDTDEPTTDWIDTYVHADDQPRVRAAIAHALGRRTMFDLVHRVRLADGGTGWVHSRAVPILGADGGIVEWFGAAADVTAQHDAEDAMRASERHLAALVDQATVGIAETDVAGRFIRVNDHYCAMVGRSRQALLAARMHDITHPDDLAANAPLFERLAIGGAPFEIVKRYIRPDGSLVWVNNHVAAIRDGDGCITSLVAMSIDITRHRLAEERLRETERRYRLAAQATNDAIWDWDLATGQVIWNEAVTTLFGHAPDTVVPTADWWKAQIHPDDRDRVVADIHAVIDGRGDAWAAEYRFARADGSHAHVVDRGTVLRDAHGKAVRMIGAMLDLTERRRAEAALREANETLEQRIAAALAERAQAEEALRQAQKMEAMGQLTGGVAHDFNNLLTPIIGGLDMLKRRGSHDPRDERLIAGALQSAERARTLVQRLLAFARRQPLQPVPVDIEALVLGVSELIASTTGPTIELSLAIDRPLAPARADPNQLEMALLNLAVNARDAMPDGGTLRIAASAANAREGERPGLAAGDYVRLSVSDTGAGMDAATLQRAVEPFFSTKGIGKGTGLGLSMVHGLASQLGGALLLSSRPGEGTQIDLWLPQSTQPVAPDRTDPGSTPAVPHCAEAPAAGTVLLVDDDTLVRMSTAEMLGELGFAVIEARSAEEALGILANGAAPDVLVTDHLMPGMSGSELARRLRTIAPGVPALVISGYAEGEGLEPDLPRLTKPFRNAELARSLARLIFPRR